MRGTITAICVAALSPAPGAAEWDWPVHWGQFDPRSEQAVPSYLHADTCRDGMTDDDFLWLWGSPVGYIYFAGWAERGDDSIDKFRLGFFDDVPASPDDDRHPGELLYQKDFERADPADPLKLGWRSVWDGVYRINIPQREWFVPGYGAIVWISVQAVMVTDGYTDAWYWQLLEPSWGWLDNAAFYSDPTTWALSPGGIGGGQRR